MELKIYATRYFSESSAALGKAVDPSKPRGNTRHHAKALYKQNRVEHNVSYNYNPPREPVAIAQNELKSTVEAVASKLQLLCSLKRSCSISSQSDTHLTFSFVAFGFDEQAVLKIIPEFDTVMMKHGWDSLVVSIAKLDGSVERVDFTMKTTKRYGGMHYDLKKEKI